MTAAPMPNSRMTEAAMNQLRRPMFFLEAMEVSSLCSMEAPTVASSPGNSASWWALERYQSINACFSASVAVLSLYFLISSAIVLGSIDQVIYLICTVNRKLPYMRLKKIMEHDQVGLVFV